MKTTYLQAGRLLLAAAGLVLVSGCVVQPNGQVAFQPFVIAPAPVVYVGPPPVYVAPEVDVQIMVPDYYVWDGYENIGFIGGSYFYLGAGNVWLAAEPFRLDRFHGWERYNPGWRDHAILNDRFRNDRFGHAQPMRSEQVRRDELTGEHGQGGHQTDSKVRHDEAVRPGEPRHDTQAKPGKPGTPAKAEPKNKKDEEPH